jgi:hypothetical protein
MLRKTTSAAGAFSLAATVGFLATNFVVMGADSASSQPVPSDFELKAAMNAGCRSGGDIAVVEFLRKAGVSVDPQLLAGLQDAFTPSWIQSSGNPALKVMHAEGVKRYNELLVDGERSGVITPISGMEGQEWGVPNGRDARRIEQLEKISYTCTKLLSPRQ